MTDIDELERRAAAARAAGTDVSLSPDEAEGAAYWLRSLHEKYERVMRGLRRDPLAARSADAGHQHPVNIAHHDEASHGERLADRIAAGIGSWRFLIIQSVIVAGWVVLNLLALFRWHWDPYPFILLNLAFSTQAAYTGPVLLLAGNRQAQKDRLTLEHAALEADKADQQNEAILERIEENTTITRRIAEHLAVQHEERDDAGRTAPVDDRGSAGQP